MGSIYQFSVVMAASIAFGLLALSLTPALCATLLKPVAAGSHHARAASSWFNRGLLGPTRRYEGLLGRLLSPACA